MPKPRCSAEFQEDLPADKVCVGCDGFVPAGLSHRSDGKAPRPMWAPVPRLGVPAVSVGARPSRPQPVVDRFNRKFGGNWQAVEAAARTNRAGKNSPDLSEVAGFGFFDDEW